MYGVAIIALLHVWYGYYCTLACMVSLLLHYCMYGVVIIVLLHVRLQYKVDGDDDVYDYNDDGSIFCMLHIY